MKRLLISSLLIIWTFLLFANEELTAPIDGVYESFLIMKDEVVLQAPVSRIGIYRERGMIFLVYNTKDDGDFSNEQVYQFEAKFNDPYIFWGINGTEIVMIFTYNEIHNIGILIIGEINSELSTRIFIYYNYLLQWGETKNERIKSYQLSEAVRESF